LSASIDEHIFQPFVADKVDYNQEKLAVC